MFGEEMTMIKKYAPVADRPTLRYAVLACSLLGMILVAACDESSNDGNSRPAAEEPFSFDVVLQSQTELRLEGVNGTVEVTGIAGATSISSTGARRVEAGTA